MKAKHVIYAMMLLSIITAAVIIAFMPDSIPTHYGMNGEADRYESKYESMILPAINIIMGLFFVIVAKSAIKKGFGGIARTVYYSGIAVLIMFYAMEVYFLYKACTLASSTLDPDPGMNFLYKLTIIGLGAVFCVAGNIMPKGTLNGVSGLRTPWSMKNDRVWQKSQRAGGVILLICGFICIAAGIFMSGIPCFIALCVILAAALAASAVASYIIYKKDLEMYPNGYVSDDYNRST